MQQHDRPAVRVRPREEADFDDLAAVLRRVHAVNGYPVIGTANPRAFLDPPTTIDALVAESSGNVVGHISLLPGAPENLAVAMFRAKHPDGSKDEVAVLSRLFVDPLSRGSGAASALVRAAVEVGRRRGLRLLLFALEKDQDAIRLYRRLRWQELGEEVFRWGEGGVNSMNSTTFVGPALHDREA